MRCSIKGEYQRNVARDAKHRAALKAMGWKALVIWEGELKEPAKVERRLRDFLNE